ncbi:MAG: hypothetical protein IPL55_13745 [Saprospiraceae bacterium]|nr:hypothetical protein [Saprospiraceae bacterium]
MKSFFKKIRQSFLVSGRTSSYLKYAIGEIILVMIGILFALQVNSWNQNRLEHIEEKKILTNLHSEFLENEKIITQILSKLTEARKSNREIIKLMGATADELKIKNLDSLFFESFPATQFTSSNQSVNNIIQGGRLNIINNEEIIKQLYNWQSQVEAVIIRESAIDDWTYDKMLPVLSKYISFKDMDTYGRFEWTGKSKLKKDYYPLFQSLEYENLLDNFLYLHLQQYEELEKAERIANQIIDLTKPYLQ